MEIEDLEAVFKDIPFGIPDEPLPPVGTLGFRIPLYGFKKWRDMFTPRQLLALGVFVKHTRKAIEEIARKTGRRQEGGGAIGAYLSMILTDSYRFVVQQRVLVEDGCRSSG